MRAFVTSQLRTLVMLTIVSATIATGTAFADAVQAGVTIPTGQRVPMVTENGHGYTHGTYAVGTIQLTYTWVGMTFPTGPFAAFQLNLTNLPSSGNTPTYPAELELNEIGAEGLELMLPASPLSVSRVGWESSVLVGISIPQSVAADPALNEDGDVLAVKLQLAGAKHLKTPTDIQVNIKLVHPTACLKVYDFITDATLAETITSTEVNVNNKGKVTATNPHGSLSHNVMVANTCRELAWFDLQIALDKSFSTQPNNNPGNAVFTFLTAGEVDASKFNIASFGAGTAHGQNLCLQNIEVPGDSTFLASVHMSINNGSSAASLPVGGTFDGFLAQLMTANSGCNGTPAPVTPIPTSASLSFTIK